MKDPCSPHLFYIRMCRGRILTQGCTVSDNRGRLNSILFIKVFLCKCYHHHLTGSRISGPELDTCPGGNGSCPRNHWSRCSNGLQSDTLSWIDMDLKSGDNNIITSSSYCQNIYPLPGRRVGQRYIAAGSSHPGHFC